MSSSIPSDTLLTPDQRRTLHTLINTDGWDQRGCRDALAWDLPPLRPAGASARIKQLNAYTRRLDILDRRKACRACPVLAACTAYANTNPYVTGVIAGRLGPAT